LSTQVEDSYNAKKGHEKRI
jgi:hypothetical protein